MEIFSFKLLYPLNKMLKINIGFNSAVVTVYKTVCLAVCP